MSEKKVLMGTAEAADIEARAADAVNESPEQMPLHAFTPKERRVARYLLFGKSRREIAAALGVSENTVKTHAQNIFT